MPAVQMSESIQQGLDAFFGFLTSLLAFLVILVVGYLIARVVSKVVQKVAEKAGLDKACTSLTPSVTSTG